MFATIVLAAVATATPAKTVDYGDLAFYPGRWKEAGQSTKMVPWQGEEVVFLTVEDRSSDLDPKVMAKFVETLDKGWSIYAEITGQKPRERAEIGGRSAIAAVPGSKFTCGFGCGMVGASGIEVGNFYAGDYKKLRKDPTAVPHYYFYEMGRNYFTFGDRHNAFTTGFAVFMRYVCLDRLGLKDGDKRTRDTIEKAERELRKTGLTFREAFSSHAGLSEKENRIPGMHPTDQPVVYASAMLKLRKKYGDEWTAAFFRNIARCPGADPKTPEGFAVQGWSWVLAASFAAGEDLSPVFEKRWGLEVSEAQREFLDDIDWRRSTPGFKSLVSKLVKRSG